MNVTAHEHDWLARRFEGQRAYLNRVRVRVSRRIAECCSAEVIRGFSSSCARCAQRRFVCLATVWELASPRQEFPRHLAEKSGRWPSGRTDGQLALRHLGEAGDHGVAIGVAQTLGLDAAAEAR